MNFRNCIVRVNIFRNNNMRESSAMRACLIAASVLILSGCISTASFARVGERVIPLDMSGPRPTAQLTFGNHPSVSVIFDTGAAGNVIMPELAKTLALPNEGEMFVGGHGGGAPLRGFVTTLPSGKLGDAFFSNARAVVVDMKLPLPGISGVFSPNSYSGSLVRYEFAKSRVVILAKTPGSLPNASAENYTPGLHGGPGLPQTKMDVAGQVFDAHIDTGSSYSFIFPLTLAKDIKLVSALVPAPRPIRMAGSEHKTFEGKILGNIKVGGISFETPNVLFVEGFPAVNIGTPILKQLIVVLDPAERRSWVLSAM